MEIKVNYDFFKLFLLWVLRESSSPENIMQKILVCQLLPQPTSTLIAGLFGFPFSIIASQFVMATLCSSDGSATSNF